MPELLLKGLCQGCHETQGYCKKPGTNGVGSRWEVEQTNGEEGRGVFDQPICAPECRRTQDYYLKKAKIWESKTFLKILF